MAGRIGYASRSLNVAAACARDDDSPWIYLVLLGIVLNVTASADF